MWSLIGKKPANTIWIVLQNVDGIPTNQNRDIKLDCLYTFTNKHQIDIFALTELNTAWDLQTICCSTTQQNMQLVGSLPLEHDPQWTR